MNKIIMGIIASAILSVFSVYAELTTNVKMRWVGDIPFSYEDGYYVHSSDFFGEVDVVDGVITSVVPISFYVTTNENEPFFDSNKTNAVHFKYTLTDAKYIYSESESDVNPFDLATYETDFNASTAIEKDVEYSHLVGTPMKLTLKVRDAHRDILLASDTEGMLIATFVIKPQVNL